MDRFQDNLQKWLQTYSSEELLSLDVESIRREGEVHFCLADSGQANLQKGAIYLHAQTDPMREAEEWFAALKLKHVQVLFIYGIGLGYYYEAAKHWLREDSRRYLVFLEDDPEVLHCFFGTERCSEMLSDSQVIITLLSPSLSQKIAQYTHLSNLFMGATFLYTGLASYQKYKTAMFHEHQATVSFMTTMGMMLFSETINYGVPFFRNFFFNALELPRSYSGMDLQGKFVGVPAIICGAGPSLNKNIEVLATLGNQALIFAGGTALNALNARGVMPHFGVGIDPNPDQFTRLIMNHAYELPFLYRCRMRHEALQMVHGDRLYISGSGGYKIGKWLEKQLGIEETIELEEGFNVLNFSVLFAHAMGCNPIICVGVDLAYSEGLSYASGVVSHPIHNLRGNFRTKLEEEELISKKDIYGRPIFTLWKWVAESMWYTYFFDTQPGTTLINATEGGIGFPKVPNMTLQEVKEKYLQKEYDLGNWIHGEIQNSPMPQGFRKEKIREVIRGLNESLVRCGQHCQKVVELMNQQQMDSAPADLEEEIVKEQEELVQEEAYEVMLQKFHDDFERSQGLELRRLKAEEKQMTPQESKKQKRELELERYRFVRETSFLNCGVIEKALEIEDANQAFRSAGESIDVLKKKYPVPKRKEGDFRDHALEGTTVQRLHYPSGTLKMEARYLGDKLHGLSRFYSEKGVLLAISQFIEGKQEGEAWTYYFDGAVHSVREFQQGQKVGLHRYFYADGIPKSILPYKEGKLDGEVLLYAPNGTLVRRLSFLQDKRHGKEQIWNERGALLIECEYDHERPIGISKMWHPNGKLAKEVHYDHNSNRLEEKQWNAEGLPIEVKESNDYFNQMHKETHKLTASLNEIVSTLSTLAPSYEQKMHEEEVFKPAGKPLEPNLNEDLAKLQEELIHLHSLDNAIKTHLVGHADDPKEAIWKTPASRQEIEKQFNAVQSQMNEEMEKIQQGIKQMLDVLKGQDTQDKQD